MQKISIALAQLNPVVGDIVGNQAKLVSAWREAKSQDADLVITTELCLSGYPPEDLVIKPSFVGNIEAAIMAIAQECADGPAMLLGTPWREDGKLYNAALLIEGGKIIGKTFKYDLPNYACFDEKRIFSAGQLPSPMLWRDMRLGVMICEDIWTPTVSAHLKQSGAQILIVPNSSPYETDKYAKRMSVAQKRARETGLPVIYTNQLGGQDELVFDGASFALDAQGTLCAQAEAWVETNLLTQWSHEFSPLPSPVAVVPVAEEAIYNALMIGLRDYVKKNKFSHVLLGLSGGIDSALVTAIAADALGPDRVHTVMMPSPYTSEASLKDAADCAKALGCRLDSIVITPAMAAFDEALKPHFTHTQPDLTEENIQARCRGILLMALSNKFGAMVLATGNKSEMAVAYATLYGDMCGGYAPLKDVYKTEVYRLSEWRNANKPKHGLGPRGEVIPINILAKAPTAELRPNQTDQDSLPPYDRLDAILQCLIERDMGLAACVAEGHDAAMVKRAWKMLDRAEYKRRQSPPGPKITTRHLGRDRHYPITDGYTEK